jgi:WD40 repeat protein
VEQASGEITVTGAPLLDVAQSAHTCAFSPDGRTFVTQGSDNPLCRWETESWSVLPGGWGGSRDDNGGKEFPTDCIVYHPEGTMLASSYGVRGPRGFDSVIYLRDPATGSLLADLRAEFASAHPTAIAFSPTGDYLAGIFGPYLRAWHVPSRAEVAARKTGTKHLKGLAFTPDARRLVTVSNDEHVRLWDTSSWSEVGGFQWKVGKLTAVAIAPDGMRMAAGSSTGKIVIWDVVE